MAVRSGYIVILHSSLLVKETKKKRNNQRIRTRIWIRDKDGKNTRIDEYISLHINVLHFFCYPVTSSYRSKTDIIHFSIKKAIQVRRLTNCCYSGIAFTIGTSTSFFPCFHCNYGDCKKNISHNGKLWKRPVLFFFF